MKLVYLCVLCITILGCTAPVTNSDIAAANFPSKPTTENSDAQINQYLQNTLKDPDSLKLKCEPARKGWGRQFRERKPDYGWIVPCSVNAKNSFGGYTGPKPYIFLFTSQGLKILEVSMFREFNEHIGYLD